MPICRALFFGVLSAAAAGLTRLLWVVLAPGGWTALKLLILVCFVGVAPWLGVCVGNALPGFLIRLLLARPGRAVLPVVGDIESGPIIARTAIAVTVRNEDMAEVLPALGRLLQGLAPFGDRFVAFLLSDTADPALAAREEAAVAAFSPRVGYRRRLENTGFKAGNLMDFLDHHEAEFELALVLDADSEMSANSVLRLVRAMQAAPRMGIIQHLTVGTPAVAAFPRLFQFGMRAGMRIWATGQAWWQGDAGPYWGHNAILRIAPFRAHARLAALSDGSTILSHDQVEAARLRAAGWGVCVWAEEAGSLEKNPPALPEFLRRDARWLAGNMQYRHLLLLPGLAPMGRWQLVQAMLLFAGAPLYTAMLALAALNAACCGADVPRGALLALTLAWTAAIYAPKLLGYAEVLLSRDLRAQYGGGRVFAAGVVAEFGFTLLLDALSQPSKTLALTRLAVGARAGWLPQNRGERGVGWREASRLFWPHTLFGVAVFALLAQSSAAAVLWAVPFAGGLLVAIPFCVLTASPSLSGWLRRRGIAATPEELQAATRSSPSGSSL